MLPKLAGPFLLGACALTWACTISSTDTSDSPSETRSASRMALDDQLVHGATMYGVHCASCHGSQGEGTRRGPAVVGVGALPLDPPLERRFRKGQFHTALDVALFATASMPPDPEARAAVSEADYWAILAFDLAANGIALEAPLDAASAESLVLHP